MTKILRLPRLLFIVLLLIFELTTTVLAQGEASMYNVEPLKSAPKMPEGFPEWVKTGNPDNDAKTYAEAKKAWIETHIEEYIAMQPGLSEEGKSLLATISITKEETPNLAGQPRPKMTDFANEMDFHTANKAWIVANGDIQTTLIFENERNRCKITKSEYEALDEMKRTYVDEHILDYEIINE